MFDVFTPFFHKAFLQWGATNTNVFLVDSSCILVKFCILLLSEILLLLSMSLKNTFAHCIIKKNLFPDSHFVSLIPYDMCLLGNNCSVSKYSIRLSCVVQNF